MGILRGRIVRKLSIIFVRSRSRNIQWGYRGEGRGREGGGGGLEQMMEEDDDIIHCTLGRAVHRDKLVCTCLDSCNLGPWVGLTPSSCTRLVRDLPLLDSGQDSAGCQWLAGNLNSPGVGNGR